MQRIFFIVTLLLISTNAFSQQHYRAIETGLYKNDKIVKRVKYYSVSGDTAKLLQYKNGRLLIDSSSKTERILFLYKNKQMIFDVIPDSIIYIKIIIDNKNAFNISMGLEYDEGAGRSNKKYYFVN